MKRLFTKSDCVEIYYALDRVGQTRLKSKVRIDGEKLAAGGVNLTPKEMNSIYWALNDKRDRLMDGAYDDMPGEYSAPGSQTSTWAQHLGAIMVKLFKMASGSKTLHSKTSLHLLVCPNCRTSAA